MDRLTVAEDPDNYAWYEIATEEYGCPYSVIKEEQSAAKKEQRKCIRQKVNDVAVQHGCSKNSDETC